MAVRVLPATESGWLAFVAGPRVLVVNWQGQDDLVDAAWRGLNGPDGFQGALDLLTSRGLGATPDFALIEWEPSAASRIIIRGPIEISITDAAGASSISASGVSTWVERSVAGVVTLEFDVPGAVGAATSSLPLEGGVTLAARIELSDLSETPHLGASPAASAALPVAPPPVAAPVTVTAQPIAGPTVAVATPVAKTATPAAAPRSSPAAAAPVESAAASEVDLEATMADRPGQGFDAGSPVPEASAPADDSYDYLFGATMYRSVADAAVSEPVADSGESGAGADGDAVAGDHDGHTVLTSDLAKIRGSRRTKSAAPAPAAGPSLVLVLSTTGAREPLQRPILVGRSPSVSKVSGGQIPRLLTLGSIDQDISRNHAQFALEGGTVVVTDLHSKNGTSIVLPGRDPQKLRAGEPTSVIVGTVVDLGGGITLTVDED